MMQRWKSHLVSFAVKLSFISVLVPDVVLAGTPQYWLEGIKHQGVAAFNPESGYQVFRNVLDFGAKGDGMTDDTAAINAAIASGNRCNPATCQSSTTTAAVVYFPSGTYVISSPLIDYYETQIIGNPNELPILKASANFTGQTLVEGNQGDKWNPSNIFYRQVRNLEIDMLDLSPQHAVSGIRWPTSQATSLDNVVVRMSEQPGTQHRGVVIPGGGGGFVSNLVLHGGLVGAELGGGNPTVRNVTSTNAVTGILISYDWGSMYRDIAISNCSTAVNMSKANSVGAVTFIDSRFKDANVGFLTAFDAESKSVGGSLILENIELVNVTTAVTSANGTALDGSRSSLTVRAWGQGHAYNPDGPHVFQRYIQPNPRPMSLISDDSRFYARSKPQYAEATLNEFISVRDGGARGDGITDDTTSIQQTVLKAARENKIVFFDAGTYKITDTLHIPGGSRLVGESFPVIMAAGKRFSDMQRPRVAVQVGHPGEAGSVEWSDIIVSTQGPAAGAILIEWNLASWETPSGMWDVHARVGGFTGSNLQLAQCPPRPDVSTPPAAPKAECIAAFMTMHITKSARGLYMENIWLWTADHDLDSTDNNQVTVYTGRGLYVESPGPVWMYKMSVEHHSLYQYQFVGAQDIFIGFAQSETPYYQPNPYASIPYPPVKRLNDPTFKDQKTDAWAFRVVDSSNLLYYGGGHFSYFDNYNTSCSAPGNGMDCQTRIVDIEGYHEDVYIYNMLTAGAKNMVEVDNTPVAYYADNLGGPYPSIIAMMRFNRWRNPWFQGCY